MAGLSIVAGESAMNIDPELAIQYLGIAGTMLVALDDRG